MSAWIVRRFPAFGSRSFRRYWIAGFVSDVGNWGQNITIPYVLLQLTHDPRWVGIVGFVQLVSQVPATAYGGKIADEKSRIKIIKRLTTVMLLLAAVMAFLVYRNAHPVTLVILTGMLAFVFGAQHPSWQSLPSELVPRETMQSAADLVLMKFQAARACGPILGGLIISLLGPTAVILANVGTYLIVLGFVATAGTLELPAGASDKAAAPRMPLLRVLRIQSVAIAVTITAVIATFAATVVQLTPIMAERMYRVGPTEYGILAGAFGVGSLIVAIGFAMAHTRAKRSRFAMLGVTVAGIAFVTAGTFQHYVVGVILVAVIGGCFAAVTSNTHASLQTLQPSNLRGRAIALYLMALRIGTAIGVVVLVWLAEAKTSAIALTAAGTGLTIAAALMWLFRSHLSHIDASPGNDAGQ